MFNFWPIRPYGDTVEKRYKIFVVSRIMWRARKPLVIVLIGVLICFVSYVSYDHLYSSNGVKYIYNKYYEIYDVSSDQKSYYIQAIKSYREKDFEKAAELFYESSKEDNFKIQYNFYLAASYIQCNKCSAAINIYKEILGSENNSYFDDAMWYLGLCYLKEYEIDNAHIQFKELVNNQGEYAEQAFNILQLLEKLND